MKIRIWICAFIVCIGIGVVDAQAISVKTFGRGSTPAEAVADGKRQALREVHDAVLASRDVSVAAGAANTPKQLSQVRVIRTKKLASSLYEVELEAEVTMPLTTQSAPRMKAVFVIDPRSQEHQLGGLLLDEAKKRLAEGSTLAVVDDFNSQAARLLERVRSAGGRDLSKPSSKDMPVDFDLLFVLSYESPKVIRHVAAGEIRELWARLMVIDVTNEEILTVTTIKSQISNLLTDMNDVLARDIGHRTAKIATDYASRLPTAGERLRVIRVPSGNVRLQVGQQVDIFRATVVGQSLKAQGNALTTGEVIGLSASAIKVWADEPLRRSGRYIVKPLFNDMHRGIISDSDW